jgi:hypothetical protein
LPQIFTHNKDDIVTCNIPSNSLGFLTFWLKHKVTMSSIRHHFVPQGYLRGFTDEREESRTFVWVYDKQPNRQPRKKSVRSIAWAEAYYSQERDDGSLDHDALESLLAQTIDNEIPKILQQIKSAPGVTILLDEQSRGALAFFIGLSLTRVPSFRDGINNMYTALAQSVLGQLANSNSEIADGLIKFGVRAQAKSWVSLEPMIKMAERVATSALQKNWQFFVPPPEVPFVTSDNPVIFSGGVAGLRDVGPAHPGAELVMNLRKELAIVCTPKRGYSSMQTFSLSVADARKFNRGVVQAARQRVFADHHSTVLDAFVKKYNGYEQRIIV